MCGSRVLSQTLDRPSLPYLPYGIQEDAQGSPEIRETLIQPFAMPLNQEATMGFEPMIRVLQNPTQAIRTLARLWPDSV